MGLRKKKSLIDQASDYVEGVRPQIESAMVSARDEAFALIAEAREKAGPAIAEAREKAGPALAEARAKAAPLIASGAALAAERAAAGRELATAKVAQLKAEPEPRKGGKLKKVLIFLGVATAVGLVAKKLQSGAPSDNWQSSYVPVPPPAQPARPAPPTHAAAPAAAQAPAAAEAPAAKRRKTEATGTAAEDAAGSSPDEAIADLAEAPHPVTTPDHPAEVVALEDDEK